MTGTELSHLLLLPEKWTYKICHHCKKWIKEHFSHKKWTELAVLLWIRFQVEVLKKWSGVEVAHAASWAESESQPSQHSKIKRLQAHHGSEPATIPEKPSSHPENSAKVPGTHEELLQEEASADPPGEGEEVPEH